MIVELGTLERKLNYFFKNPKLLIQALTHRSVRGEHNERLEFLGDSILNFIVGHALYQKLPHAKEGELSRYRALLVCEDSLAALALTFNLSDFLILGAGELRSGGFRRKSIMADALEAIIAAIYLDADLLTCQKIVETWFAEHLINVAQMKIKKDPKSAIQELVQSKKLPLPEYTVIKITGADHDQTFHVTCQVLGIEEVMMGKGSNRRIAEQEATGAFLKEVFEQEL